MSWSDRLLDKTRAIHAEIAALQAYLAGHSPALSEAEAEALFANHYAMLDEIYLRQLPFARAAAGADLFLNYRGPGAALDRAGIGAADRLFGNIRTQVATMTRAIVGTHDAAEREAKARGEAELTVTAYAPGLYVGFALPSEPAQADAHAAGEIQHTALRQSLENLGVVAHHLPEAGAHDRIVAAIDDPQVRDATLGAIRKLLPTRDRSVEAVELRGRLFPFREPAAIDRRARQAATHLMVEPMEAADSAERATFVGHILQIDYELRRFELRQIDDSPFDQIRCAYSEALAPQCEGLAKRRVEISGPVAFRRGRPRLLRIESIREAS